MQSNAEPACPGKFAVRHLISEFFVIVCALSALFLSGCGGGGGSSSGGGGGATLPQSFSISLSASTVTLPNTGSQALTATLIPQNSFSAAASCSLSGVPTGVTVSPATFSLSSGSPQQFQLATSGSAAAGTSTATVSCTSGSLSAQAQFTLTILAAPAISLSAQPSSFTIYPGTTQTTLLAVTGVGGASGTVSGTVTGLPAGLTVAEPSFTTTVNSSIFLDFTAAASAATSGTATVKVTSGTLSATLNIPITVSTTPDFSLLPSTTTGLSVYQSATASFTVIAKAVNGFSQPIAVSFSGIPTGVTFSPSSFTISPGSSKTVQVATTFAAAVNLNSTVTIAGVGGGVTHQYFFSLYVLTPYLSLIVSPSTLTVPAGATGTFDVRVLTNSNSTGTVGIQLGNAPAGVKITPASVTIPASGELTTFFVEAQSNASAGNLSVTATYGPYTQTGGLAIAIGAANSFPPVPLSASDQVVSTDALTPYPAYPYPNYLIYHAATNRFFSTDAYLNQLNVVDANTRMLAARLAIPGAFGIDQAPDGSVIYVGTIIGDLYVVDPVNLTVLKRYPSTAISPYGFAANAVYAMADGKLLLEEYDLTPGYSWIDGNGPLALWDPATNAIVVFQSALNLNGEAPVRSTCLTKFENVILANNRTRALLLPVLTSEGSSLICSLDPETGSWIWSPVITGGTNSALTAFALSSDTKTLVAYDGYDLYNIDTATLAVKSSFKVNTPQSLLNYPYLILSSDNTQAFLTDTRAADVMDVYDLASGQQTGWIPQYHLISPSTISPEGPLYQAVSSSGLAAGVMEGGGIALLDTSAVHPMPIGSRFTLSQLDVPYGPSAGGTETEWAFNGFSLATPPPLGSIYFGPNAATGVSNSSYNSQLVAVTPAGSAGPVDVRAFATDGGSQFLPSGFSYGPWVQEAATSYSTAEGGGIGSLYGFAFGPQNGTDLAAYFTAPSDLQVSVGATSAAVLGYAPNPYGYSNTPPVPANALLYTIPPGTAGATASIQVSNSTGSTTAITKLTYLPALQQFSVDGQLADGLYDPTRDVYYFTDATQVRVFSLAKGAWQTPIPIPAPKNAYGAQRLFGLALSPNGSKLAISDPGAIAIYLVNPDQPSSVQSFPYASQIFDPITEEPSGLAVTNSGIVYFATFDLDGDGGRGYLYTLDPSTGLVKEVTGQSLSFPYLPTEGGDPDGRLAITADGSRVYLNDNGALGYVDTSAGYFVVPATNSSQVASSGYELVLAPNQASIFGAGLLSDTNLNAFGMQVLDRAESLDAEYVYGAALSADGSLLFQPGTYFIDVFDGHTGVFRSRIALPVPLSSNFRALVSNNRDSRLVAITGTGNGIAVIDLNSLPEPNPLPYLSAEPAPLAHSATAIAAASARSAARPALPGVGIAPALRHRASPLIASRLSALHAAATGRGFRMHRAE